MAGRKNEKPQERRWPLMVVPMPDGRLFVRWFAGRRDVMKTIRRGGANDVVYIDSDAVRLEISFHSSVEAAQQALKNDLETAALAVAPARGRA